MMIAAINHLNFHSHEIKIVPSLMGQGDLRWLDLMLCVVILCSYKDKFVYRKKNRAGFLFCKYIQCYQSCKEHSSAQVLKIERGADE